MTDVFLKTAVIGILCWEEGGSPRGLEQLEKLPGNSTNPEPFEGPVKCRTPKGSKWETLG